MKNEVGVLDSVCSTVNFYFIFFFGGIPKHGADHEGLKVGKGRGGVRLHKSGVCCCRLYSTVHRGRFWRFWGWGGFFFSFLFFFFLFFFSSFPLLLPPLFRFFY